MRSILALCGRDHPNPNKHLPRTGINQRAVGGQGERLGEIVEVDAFTAHQISCICERAKTTEKMEQLEKACLLKFKYKPEEDQSASGAETIRHGFGTRWAGCALTAWRKRIS